MKSRYYYKWGNLERNSIFRVFFVAIVSINMIITIFSISNSNATAEEPFIPNVKIFDNHFGSSQIEPSLAIDENGTAYIVWVNAENSDILFSKSTDGGTSFTKPIRLNEDNFGGVSPSITVEGAIVYIVWSGNNNIHMAKSMNNGKTFLSPEAIWNSSSLTPSITVEGNNLYVAFIVRTSLAWSDDICLIKSTDGGETFFEPSGKLKNLVSGNDRHPSIKVKGENVYVGWIGGNPGGMICFGFSINGGESFELLNVTDNTDYAVMTPTDRAIAIDENGNIYIVWNTLDDSEIYINKSVDAGQTFLPGVKINYGNTTGANPSIAVDQEGNVHVIWHGHKNATDAIYYDISIDGESFGTDIKVNDEFTNIVFRSNPSLGVDKMGEIYVVWQAQREDYGDGEWTDDVYFSTTNHPIFPVTLNSPIEITSNSMNQVWNQNNNSDFFRYELHMATDANFIINQSTLVGSITEETTIFYNVTGLSEDVTYYFKARLYDSGGLYTDSNEVSGRTLDEVPATVVLNNPKDITNSSMNLTWNQNMNTDYAKYEIHISTDGNFTVSESTVIANITVQETTFYDMTGLAEDETYYFKVRVYDLGGSYSESNEVHGKTLGNDEYISGSSEGFFSMSDGSFWIILSLIILVITVAIVTVKRKSIMRFYRSRRGVENMKEGNE